MIFKQLFFKKNPKSLKNPINIFEKKLSTYLKKNYQHIKKKLSTYFKIILRTLHEVVL